jgi:cytosine permease
MEKTKEKVAQKESMLDFDKYVENEVPQSARQSWQSVMFIWMGTMVCLPSILLGKELAMGLNLWLALFAGVAGYLLITVVTIFQGMQSTDLGRPTVVAAKPSFGSGIANKLFSLVIAVSLVGWFGVQTGIGANSLIGLFRTFNVELPNILANLIMGIVVLVSAIYGFKVLEKVSKYTVPILLIIFLWAFITAVSKTDLSALMSYRPAQPSSLLDGVILVVGSFVVGAVIGGDFTRFNKSRKDTVKSAAFGIVPAAILLLFIGSFLTIVSINSGQKDPNVVEIISTNLPFPVIGYLILFIATWKTNISNAYSAGIAIVNAFDFEDRKRPVVTAVVGVIGTVLAVLGIATYFQTFLSLLTNLIAPIAGVMIADYWIIRKGKKEGYMERKSKDNSGIIAYALGSVLGVMATFQPAFLSNYPTLLGSLSLLSIVVSMVAYLVLKKFRQVEKNVQTQMDTKEIEQAEIIVNGDEV